ncbi:MAG: response regulator [Spirochaetales bacterium]|nr:response regulator [Spirochaetales bacterium]
MESALFFIGFYTALAVYHLIIFIGRKKDKGNLAFALFCLNYMVILFWFSVYKYLPGYSENIYLIGFSSSLLLLGHTFLFMGRCFLDMDHMKRFIQIYKVGSIVCGVVCYVSFLVWHNTLFITLIYGFIMIHLLYFTFALLPVVGRQFRKKGRQFRIDKIINSGYIILDLFLCINIVFLFSGLSMPAGITRIFFLLLTLSIAYAYAEKFNREHNDLFELKNNLSEKVKQRTKQLEEEQKKKDAFFINIAHEIKTPVTLITNYFRQYLAEHTSSPELETIKYNLDKLQTDVINFFDLKKLEKPGFFYDHSLGADCSALLERQLEIFGHAAKQKQLVLHSSIQDGCFGGIDPDAWIRIINNLVGNAVRYTEPGGEIRVSLKRAGDRLNFTVSDTGEGIDPRYQSRIFEPYFQIEHKKKNIQGMGMGLSIVKLILDAAHGSIVCNSLPGRGTDFEVTLPSTTGPLTESAEDLPPAADIMVPPRTVKLDHLPYNKEHENILIVEDNIQLLSFLVDQLKDFYNVFYAADGKAALEKIMHIPVVQLIISDVMMDEMDGYEFLRELHKKEDYRSVPFIFLSARTAEEERLNGLARGPWIISANRFP